MVRLAVVLGAVVRSNWIDSTSSASNDISFRRVPSPTVTTNLPPPKLVMRPLTMLPSFKNIVSANATVEMAQTKASVNSGLKRIGQAMESGEA